MCRWLAYYGDPIPIETLVFRRQHSLIDQSLHARQGATTTNGDGFGIGWYDEHGDAPGVYRSVHPAWNDRNLRELAAHIRSPLFFAHIRASTGTAVQETNAHPFRHGRWLFMHNGLVRDFPRVQRDLLLAVDAALVPEIEGSTDSELLFHLALTFGLEGDAVLALERVAGFVEDVAARHGIEEPLQMSVAVTDGERIVAARYSSEGRSRSLFFSTDARALKEQYPEIEELQALSDEARAVVSEPLGDLVGAWNEVPESSVGIVQPGEDELRPFTPRRGAIRPELMTPSGAA
ncbi:MAG TPA: class II glutamine amidotransferase [Gaiellaceae bacterium]|nr:class II glutamine amidotransferase [Gaiellaceae bacterium]